MRIGAPYCVHGKHEKLAYKLGRSLEEDPVDPSRVFALPANERAIAEGLRMTQENMALSFLYANRHSHIYERRRAAEVLGWMAAGQFDLIIDIHSTPFVHDRHYAGIGLHTTNETIAAAQFLHADNLVVGNFGIPHVVNKAMSLEIFSPRNEEDADATITYWRRQIAEMARYDSLQDLAADFRPERPAEIWSYQGTVLTHDIENLEERLSEEYADGILKPINMTDRVTMGIPLEKNGKVHTPYTLGFGGAFEQLGAYGEYVFHVGPADPKDQWRDIASAMAQTDDHWIGPEDVKELSYTHA